jgi:hypothetical protein
VEIEAILQLVTRTLRKNMVSPKNKLFAALRAFTIGLLAIASTFDAFAQSSPQDKRVAYAKRILTDPITHVASPETHLMRGKFQDRSASQNASATELREMARQAAVLVDALTKTSTLTQPTGLFPSVRPGNGGLALEQTLGGEVAYVGYDPKWIAGSKETGFKTKSGAEGTFFFLAVNRSQLLFDVVNFPRWQDADGEFALEPILLDDSAGKLVLRGNGDDLLLLPEGVSAFSPISVERALNAALTRLNEALARNKSQRDQAEKELATFLSPEASEKRRLRREARYQEAVSKNMSAQFLSKLRQSLDRESEPHIKSLTEATQASKVEMSHLKAKEATEKQIAALEASTRSQPACLRRDPAVDVLADAAAKWRIGVRGELDCTNLVEINRLLSQVQGGNRVAPRFLSLHLRGCLGAIEESDVQIVLGGKDLACHNLMTLIREIDWVALKRDLFKK